MEENIGIIDCGTNTFHLLIVRQDDSQFQMLHKEKVSVRIGKGGINQNQILPDAIERATNTIRHFSDILDKFATDRIFAFATSAFRNAANGEEARKAILDKTGIDIKIISGVEEAELIFRGVNFALDIGDKPALIMDIGGGSVEFIIGQRNKIFWKQSFEIGAQRLLDLFHTTDPIQSEEITGLENYLRSNLGELLEHIKKYQTDTLIGSSGTFDTLSDIYCEQRSIIKDEDASEVPLSLEGYFRIHHDLLTMTRDERMAIPGMIEMRVDMIVVASCLINFLLKQHHFREIRVSTYALKEGVLDQVLDGHF
ncbi:exopolyphosphatase [Fulvivirga ulvae]|uniref:Ppx/GppA phosphatase family protein n=1 Tax=Fulvivirga ulvae TaxID=2904245 RepID=UPI001F28C500|nr:exopolyphosphatase [Fulvivirga ulvae]UII34836.1 exopolyphosphatase [Fulvivirga ulvae]